MLCEDKPPVGMEAVFYDLNNENMTREEFQKQVSDRFQNTDSGFGNMTQRELILLQIASNLYESEVKKNRLGDIVGRSEQLPCEMCGGNIDKEDKFTDEKHCENCGWF